MKNQSDFEEMRLQSKREFALIAATKEVFQIGVSALLAVQKLRICCYYAKSTRVNKLDQTVEHFFYADR